MSDGIMIVIGDVHGEFVKLYERVRNIDAESVTFIQLGDFGLGFESPSNDYKILTRLNDRLRGKNSTMYVIRGNHDNPSFWTPDGRIEFSNIKFVQDNSILELNGKRCLFAGGAPSIDRRDRIKGVSFWENEVYRYSPFDGPIDFVFTHEVYHGVSNFSIYNDVVARFCARDETLRDYLIGNQLEMEKFYNRLVEVNDNRRVKWYHGHYHEYDCVNNDWLEVTCLSILEFKEVR